MTFEEITKKMNLLEIEIDKQQKSIRSLSSQYVKMGVSPESQPELAALENSANLTLELWQKCKSVRDEMKRAKFELWQAAQEATKSKVFKNKFFVKRDYETSNLVFAIATNNPDPAIWAATMQDPAEFEETTNTSQLYIQAGVRFFGYL